MFEIGNYRCSFKRNEDSIYLKFTDKTTYDIYSRNIDINIIEEEIKNKYILTLDNLVYVFNNNLNAENVIFVKDFDKMVLYFNKTYKFSLVLYKETLIIRDLKSRTRELENRTHELEKEIEILKNNDRPYIMDIGICKGCVRYKGDMKKYKVNSSFKKFYISSMGENYIIPNYITDEYLKHCGQKIIPDKDNYIPVAFSINHNIDHLVLYNCGIDMAYFTYFELLKIKVLEITNDFGKFNLLILKNLNKTKVEKIILRNTDMYDIFENKSVIKDEFSSDIIIPELKEIELHNCKGQGHNDITKWAYKNNVILKIMMD
jgi:hypothetical protein